MFEDANIRVVRVKDGEGAVAHSELLDLADGFSVVLGARARGIDAALVYDPPLQVSGKATEVLARSRGAVNRLPSILRSSYDLGEGPIVLDRGNDAARLLHLLYVLNKGIESAKVLLIVKLEEAIAYRLGESR